MDQSIKRMLKLIEKEGDSFAKKAEMYYQKRPELISHVEEFYRMYRSLAERYDNLTGELRKNIPSNLQSQGSGISDNGSEPATPSLDPEQKLGRRKSGHRAAGFDFFLGSGGGSSDLSRKEGEESSSSSDPESDSDDSSINNYSGPPVNDGGEGLHRRITELEVELRDVKEKLRMVEQESSDTSLKVTGNGNFEELLSRITRYEEELLVANEKLRLSEEEIARLKLELEKNGSSESTINMQNQLEAAEKVVKMRETELESEKIQVAKLQERVNWLDDSKIKELVEELRITKERLQRSENEIARLKHELERKEATPEAILDSQIQLESTQKDIAIMEVQLDAERKHVSELQETIEKYKADLAERDGEIRELKVAMSNADQNFSLEKSKLQAEISSLSEERTLLQAKLKEWVLRVESLEGENKQVEAERMAMQGLHGAKMMGLQGEIEQLKADVAERCVCVEELNRSLDALNLKYDMLMAERDGLGANVLALTADVNSREDQIHQMDEHLHQLHMEHVELIAGSEAAYKLVEELRLKVNEVEKEVERQRIVISEGAEEKREAIRQLCFSLEHYQSGYNQLRQAFSGHKRRPAVLAS